MKGKLQFLGVDRRVRSCERNPSGAQSRSIRTVHFVVSKSTICANEKVDFGWIPESLPTARCAGSGKLAGGFIFISEKFIFSVPTS